MDRRGGKVPVPRKSSDASNSSASEHSEQDEELAFPMDDDPKLQRRAPEKKPEKGSPDPSAQPAVFSPFGGGNPFMNRGGPPARGRHKDLLEGLRAEGDDSRQFQNLIELGEFLAMANEESLQGFPVDQFVPALVNLLNAEHNPEMMLLACRSLTHLVDILPAACASVVHNQAVPALCAKLLNIEYIDLAEQAMSTLEKLSMEHGVAVLKGGGLGAVLSYLDFFPTHVQRLAVQTAANICRNVPDDNWSLVADVLPALTNLLQHQDQKIVDSALLALSRLADNIGDETRLNQLASHGLLHQLLRLLSPAAAAAEKPAAVPGSSPSFSMLAAASQPPPSTVIVLRLLAALARGSAQLSQQILAQGIVHTLRQMIGTAPPAESPGGATFSPGSSPKITRSTELQSEILLLINELLPPLPADFAQVFVPSRNLLRAPPVRRVVERDEAAQLQQRIDAMTKNPELLAQLTQSLLGELMAMYQWTLNPHLRLRALAAVVKVLYHSSAASLKEQLKNIPMSNFIASLLASRDFTTISVGLHAANILFEKLPGIFLKFFRREGVITEVERLVTSLSVSVEKAKAAEEKETKGKSGSPMLSPSTPGSQPVDSAHLQSQLQLAKRFQDLQRRAEAESGLRRSAGVGEPKELTELKELVQVLVGRSAEKEQLAEEAKVLSTIAAMLVGREGVSTYELLQSNLVSALVRYINSPARVANFAAAFTSVPEALLVLVRRVQEALAKTEKFPLSLIDVAAFGNHGLNILKLLTHPFRLRLVRAEGEKALKEFPEQGILVEPLATWKVLDDYIFSRVQPSADSPAPDANAPPAPGGAPAPALGNAQQVLANLLRNLGNSNGAGNNNGNDEDMEEPEPNDEDPNSNGSNGGNQTTVSTSVPARRRLVLTLQGSPQELLPAHSVLQSLRRRGNRAALTGSDLSANFRRLWETTYVVTYRLATESEAVVPPSAYQSRQLPVATPLPQWSPMGPAEAGAVELYEQLVRNRTETEPPQAMIEDEERDDLSLAYQLIQLLRLLEALNRLVLAPRDALSASEFVNQKLSGKLMEQLADTFSLCSRSMPDWCAELAHNAGFLFPFDVRRLNLYASSYTLPRALQFITQTAGTNPPVARVPRKKVRISRERLLDSAMRVMQLENVLRTHILEIEYFGEVGTGLGPTLEFYSLTSRALLAASLGLWYSDQAPDASGYVQCKAGLFPAPYATVPQPVVEKFKFLGRFVAKAVLDQRHIDLPFSTPFLKSLLNQPLSFADLVTISPSLGRSLASLVELCKKKSQIESSGASASEIAAQLKAEEAKVEDLSLDFTMPGQPQWELKPNGKALSVTLGTLAEYVSLVCEAFLSRGVAPQLAAFAAGFDEVFPAKNLHGFTVAELDQLFCGGESAEAWSVEALQEALHADHGYSMSSKVVRHFVEVLSELSAEDRRRFLQFTTGAPRLPIGGFKALTPRMTIVRKEHPPGTSADAYLPSVMTCANYIKLPDYTSKDIVRTRMATAIREGQSSFHLS